MSYSLNYLKKRFIAEKVETLMTCCSNQSAHPCFSAKNEDSSKTDNRSPRMLAAIF